MNLLRRIANMFSGKPGGSNRMLLIYALSHRCNEPIMGEIDLLNELSQTDDDSPHQYYSRKVLHTTGESRCFDQVEIEIWFNQNKQIAEHEVQGGRWLDADQYAAEHARFHAAPAEETEDAATGATANGDTSTEDTPTQDTSVENDSESEQNQNG